jgi:predicted transcriptional regulator of viral defense system
MSSNGHGISGAGRAELSLVVGHSRFISPDQAASELGVSANVAARKLAHWAETGWLRRVRRGIYIAVPVEAVRPENWSQDAMVVANAVWSPCYFSGWTAASHWGLTEQVFRTTIVKTTQRVRFAKARLLDAEYLLTHVSKAAIDWGVKSVWQEETRLLIADPARTVVDCLDAPRIGGGIRHVAEILDAFLDDNDGACLVDYAQRLGNRTVLKRLGYLLEVLGRDEPRLVAACKAQLSSGVALLDPDGPRDGPRVPAWHLRANVHVADEGPS